MSERALLIATDGILSRRHRALIEYAPTGVSIAVRRMPHEIKGQSVDTVIVDDPLAELKGTQDD